MNSAGGAFFGFTGRKTHGATGNDGGNRMLVDHLGHRIAKQHHILIEGLDLALQFDPVDEINRNRHMLATQGVEEWVLQELTFVIAHDIFRVQELIRLHLTTANLPGMRLYADSLSVKGLCELFIWMRIGVPTRSNSLRNRPSR